MRTIVCTIGAEEKELLLYDDFSCRDEVCCMGKHTPWLQNRVFRGSLSE